VKKLCRIHALTFADTKVLLPGQELLMTQFKEPEVRALEDRLMVRIHVSRNLAYDLLERAFKAR
jgi:type II secretory pathway predicted ATPase ExeA